jgi:enediyne biosynthesis protein E5
MACTQPGHSAADAVRPTPASQDWPQAGAWLSPGQWGQATAVAVLVLTLGVAVSSRAARGDASWVFLGTFAALVTARVLWLGANPWSVWHQLNHGALLLFAFFMISDPMTTPRLWAHRVALAAAVAAGAFAWQFGAFRPHGPVITLFLASLAVPALNRRAAARQAALGYD